MCDEYPERQAHYDEHKSDAWERFYPAITTRHSTTFIIFSVETIY